MSDIQSLITLLADGRCYSGELIGRRMGVSRTAVWKQLKKLPELGLHCESVKGRGYQLGRPLELLDKQSLLSHLSPLIEKQIAELELAFIVDSTNAMALKQTSMLEDGQAYICLAEYQSQGRGRRGRQWVSPLGSNIYLSIAWQFQAGAGVLEGLSLAAGVEAVKALNDLGFDGLSLKWPNDILAEGKKLGGILLEMTGDPAGPCQLVLGMGINVAMDAHQGDIDQPWTSLSAIGEQAVSRNQLVAELINRLLPMLATYPDQGFAAYAEQWRQLDAFANQPVQITAGSECKQGLARGVNDSGALLLDVAEGRRAFYGGEVSVRPDGGCNSER